MMKISKRKEFLIIFNIEQKQTQCLFYVETAEEEEEEWKKTNIYHVIGEEKKKFFYFNLFMDSVLFPIRLFRFFFLVLVIIYFWCFFSLFCSSIWYSNDWKTHTHTHNITMKKKHIHVPTNVYMLCVCVYVDWMTAFSNVSNKHPISL